jgi:hypothetical protein
MDGRRAGVRRDRPGASGTGSPAGPTWHSPARQPRRGPVRFPGVHAGWRRAAPPWGAARAPRITRALGCGGSAREPARLEAAPAAALGTPIPAFGQQRGPGHPRTVTAAPGRSPTGCPTSSAADARRRGGVGRASRGTCPEPRRGEEVNIDPAHALEPLLRAVRAELDPEAPLPLETAPSQAARSIGGPASTGGPELPSIPWRTGAPDRSIARDGCQDRRRLPTAGDAAREQTGAGAFAIEAAVIDAGHAPPRSRAPDRLRRRLPGTGS